MLFRVLESGGKGEEMKRMNGREQSSRMSVIFQTCYRERIPQLFRAMAAASGLHPRRGARPRRRSWSASPGRATCASSPPSPRPCTAAAAAASIQLAQLPEGYRQPGMPHRLTRLEQAEHDVIRTALRANGGNKAKTAAYLGISRTTLYKALRTLGIWA